MQTNVLILSTVLKIICLADFPFNTKYWLRNVLSTLLHLFSFPSFLPLFFPFFSLVHYFLLMKVEHLGGAVCSARRAWRCRIRCRCCSSLTDSIPWCFHENRVLTNERNLIIIWHVGIVIVAGGVAVATCASIWCCIATRVATGNHELLGEHVGLYVCTIHVSLVVGGRSAGDGVVSMLALIHIR